MALTLAPRAEFLKDNQTIRIVDTSDYVGEAIDPADVRGILTITDPNLIAIVDNADFDNPDIAGAVSLTSGEYALNLDVGEIVTGNYEIVYSVDTDFDDIADYTITINVTYSEDAIPDVSISVVSSLVYGTISSTDVTDYSAVTLDTRTHSITFPASKGEVIDSNVVLNENISSQLLYIGDNIADVESGIIVKVSSENWIYATIEGSVTHPVSDSSNISGIRESYQTFYDQYVTALEENRQSLIVLQPAKEKIDESYNLWNLNTLTGNPDEATIYVDNIIEILNTVDIPTDPVVPDGTLVNAALPGFASQWLSGAGVPSPSLGRNVDFYVDTVTNIYYTKATGSWVEDGSFGGYTFNIVSGTIAVPTDADGNNPVFTNAETDIIIYKDSTDDTANWAFTKGSVSDADGTVTDNTLTLTSLTADTGYVEVTCTKLGATSLTVRVYAKKIKEGQAVVDSTSVDNSTIEFDIPTQKIRVKDGGITGAKLDSSVADDSTIQYTGTTIKSKLKLKTNAFESGTPDYYLRDEYLFNSGNGTFQIYEYETMLSWDSSYIDGGVYYLTPFGSTEVAEKLLIPITPGVVVNYEIIYMTAGISLDSVGGNALVGHTLKEIGACYGTGVILDPVSANAVINNVIFGDTKTGQAARGFIENDSGTDYLVFKMTADDYGSGDEVLFGKLKLWVMEVV